MRGRSAKSRKNTGSRKEEGEGEKRAAGDWGSLGMKAKNSEKCAFVLRT